jgi:hypothetical protein
MTSSSACVPAASVIGVIELQGRRRPNVSYPLTVTQLAMILSLSIAR